jgi:hypothetical protein
MRHSLPQWPKTTHDRKLGGIRVFGFVRAAVTIILHYDRSDYPANRTRI